MNSTQLASALRTQSIFIGCEKAYDPNAKWTLGVGSGVLQRTNTDFGAAYVLLTTFAGPYVPYGAGRPTTWITGVKAHVGASGFASLPSGKPGIYVFSHTNGSSILASADDPSANVGAFNSSFRAFGLTCNLPMSAVPNEAYLLNFLNPTSGSGTHYRFFGWEVTLATRPPHYDPNDLGAVT